MNEEFPQPAAANRPDKQLVFVCGCPRSGTTAMAQLLSGHPRVCIGRERYAAVFNRGKPFTEGLFEKDRFLAFRLEDTFYDQTRFDDFHRGFAEKFDSCEIVGDKLPYLYRRWQDVFTLRPQPIVVFLTRNVMDVAESYNRRARALQDPWPARKNAAKAVQEWNEAMRKAGEAIEAGYGSRLLVVEYEGFFENQQRMRGLLARLGLSTEPPMTAHFNSFAATALRTRWSTNNLRELTPLQKRHVLLNAYLASYRELLSHATGWRSADYGRAGAAAGKEKNAA